MENQNDSIDDVIDPQGQQSINEKSNDGGQGNQSDDSGTDEVEINGVKISMDSLRGHEKFKDVFDAYENRQSWQKKLTQESQKLRQFERDAQEYQRLKSDPRFQQVLNPQQTNKLEQIKQGFVSKWGNQINPDFLNMLVDSMAELSSHKAREIVDPLAQQFGSNWERDFLKAHPLLQRGSEEYFQVKQRVENGYDPEDAYELVFKDKIMQEKIDRAIKARDEANSRKLKQSRNVAGTSGKKSGKLTADEIYEEVWQELHGGD